LRRADRRSNITGAPKASSRRNANAEVIDASRRLIIPGLINAHTHSHGGLSKGVGDLWELDLLLNAAPWIGGGRSHEDKHLSALITRAWRR
jgi:5-methylthioadenosine/S-adenosylhomocysteine deaminase